MNKNLLTTLLILSTALCFAGRDKNRKNNNSLRHIKQENKLKQQIYKQQCASTQGKQYHVYQIIIPKHIHSSTEQIVATLIHIHALHSLAHQ